MRGCASGTQRPRDIQEMACVLRRAGSRAYHPVVASELTLDSHPTRCDPHQRVEPVESASNLSYELGQAVKALNMGELVKQNVAAFPLGPLIRSCREQQYGGK